MRYIYLIIAVVAIIIIIIVLFLTVFKKKKTNPTIKPNTTQFPVTTQVPIDTFISYTLTGTESTLFMLTWNQNILTLSPFNQAQTAGQINRLDLVRNKGTQQYGFLKNGIPQYPVNAIINQQITFSPVYNGWSIKFTCADPADFPNSFTTFLQNGTTTMAFALNDTKDQLIARTDMGLANNTLMAKVSPVTLQPDIIPTQWYTAAELQIPGP